MTLSSEEAEFFLNHLFLPPKLPNESDHDHAATKLLTLFATTAQNYANELDPKTQSDWLPIVKSIRNWRDVYQQRNLWESILQEKIKTMDNRSNLLLHLHAQNCALLITRLESSFKFEAWEVSAKQEVVLATNDSLIRDFPALAVELPLSTIHGPNFVSNLVIQLSNLAEESFIPESVETTYKGETEIEETRQSRHPRLVTEWLFLVLASCGRPCKTEAIRKRIRDEVNFEGALLPWRRSPMWNCMRAALQLAIHNSPLADLDHKHYKHFMLYFLSYIAGRLFASYHLSDYFHVLRAKIARRATKLDAKLSTAIPEFLSRKCIGTMRQISTEMEVQWDIVKSSQDHRVPIVPIGGHSHDVKLPEINPHVRELLYQTLDNPSQFSPIIRPQSSFAFSLKKSELPKPSIFEFDFSAQSDRPASIRKRKETVVVFQSWIAENLDSWLRGIRPSADVCLQLKMLIEKFWESAQACFSPYAEIMSGVLLTMFELWMALDKMAIVLRPLLRDYSPEIKQAVFEPLLIRKHSDLTRLRRVELYLQDRIQNARYGSIFSHLTATSLTVRLYDRSRRLQQVMAEIVDRAEQHKQWVQTKFQRLRRDYERLTEVLKTQDHDYLWVKDGADAGSKIHSENCRRCKNKGRALNLSIERFEETLPESLPIRKALIYELQPAMEIVIYRDCLWFVLRNVLSCKTAKVEKKLYGLQDFDPFKIFNRLPQQIGVASHVKPHSKTHRQLIKITTSIDTVFYPHAMEWQPIDLLGQLEVTHHKENNVSLAPRVRAQLGKSPYSELIDTVHDVNVSQNSVIARQSSCPPEIHVSEWCAFGSMRCGSHLQLINLLRGLFSKEFDLASSATIVLVEQMLHEVGGAAGTPTAVLRAADIDMRKPTYTNRILQHASETIKAIGDNWKEQTSAWILLVVIQRILSLNKSLNTEISAKCLQLIHAIRETGLRWVNRLIDTHSIQHVDYAQYIAASVHVHDYSQFFEKTEDEWLKLCLERDLILQIKLEQTIHLAVQATPEVLKLGLLMVWPEADPNEPFAPCQHLNNRWFEASRSRSPDSLIHYNVATGSLLVDYKPLSILPETYTKQDLYKQVLGDRLLNVVASDDPNMEFMTMSTVGGHQLYFGLAGSPPELQIHARKDDLHFIAILRSKFGDDLPEQIINKSSPWLCVDTSCIELRNIDHPWHLAVNDWKIVPLKMAESLYQIESESGEFFLMDNRAGVGSTICSVLSSLEMSKHIHITRHKAKKKLSIELPRYGLHFEVDPDGQLQCIELAAFVPRKQELGTFYGLRNRLILQDKVSKSSNPKTWVLVPFGEVTVEPVGSHVSVDIDIEGFDIMRFYKYRVDRTLRKLVPDTIEGYLWKAYLHACTSSSLPDELTDCTGIEEAFRTLDDRLLQTCVPFTVEADQILERIAQLSAYRSFYPNHTARHMQQTTWSENLSFMMQHDGFYKKVNAISYHNFKTHFLHEGVKYVIPAYRGNDEDLVLADRAMYAWQKYWPTGFTSAENMPCGDKLYVSRDKQITRDTDGVFEIAAAISSWDVSGWVRCDFYNLLCGCQRTASDTGVEPLLFSPTFTPTSLTQLLTFDMEKCWTSLFRYCLDAKETYKTEILFAMSLIVFGNPELLERVKILLPFVMMPELKAIGLPGRDKYSDSIFGNAVDWDRYDPLQGNSVDWNAIEGILDECQIKRMPPSRAQLPQHDGPIDVETSDESEIRAQRRLVKLAVKAAWSEKELRLPADDSLNHFNIDLLRTMLIGRLCTWMKNNLLQRHCEEWEEVLEGQIGPAKPLTRPKLEVQASDISKSPRLSGYQSLSEVMKEFPADGLMSASAEPTGFDGSINGMFVLKDNNGTSAQAEEAQIHQELEELVTCQVGIQDETTTKYRERLLESISALREKDKQSKSKTELPDQTFLDGRLKIIRQSYQALQKAFSAQLKPRNTGQEALRLAGLWPTATAPSLLQLMSKSHRGELSKQWRDLLVIFARELCSLQRIERIVRFHEANDHFAFRKEVENEAHDHWKAGDNLDWLLLEIQNDMLIRPTQVEVAKKMLESENGVLQLQMGDGKSSVILPLFCISAAADMKYLVRVIVLKSLAKETITSLSKSLSGLVQTPLYWLPFSRSTKLTKETAGQFRDLWKECRASRGILLALPEHLNSFRLIGNDQLTAGRLEIAQRLLAAQKFLDNNTRDIIDESDEVLKPAYELVYTNGSPKLLSGAPHRWELLLSILDIVQACAKDVHSQLPHGLEYKPNEQGSFATIRILTVEAKKLLLDAVLQSILMNGLPTLSFDNQDPDVIQAVSDFVQSIEIKGRTHQAVKPYLRIPEQSLAIHLLRGLFAWGFLGAAFEKRFFVNYGLDRSRCLSAVPYRSKGVAATAAEFAQPDMGVLLTSLAYLYSGLEKDDIRRALSIMLRLPDPSDEYSRWISGSAAPERIRSVASINLQDDDCVEDIHKYLHKRKTVIDFFLRTVVLPRESKEYSHKLSSSAWDLCDRANGKVTSGFSGTCDSLLCDSMPPKKVKDLLHFDAAVLKSLLQKRNRRYVKANDAHGNSLDTMSLLRLIEKEAPQTSVIIDVGAQSLDKNQDVAEMWLHIRQESSNPNKKLAAVFFDEQDEKKVVTLDGSVSAWQSSPYKEQQSACLFYLDQFRCRGTDLLLPDDFVAALLLGPQLPKDAYVQAAMRLRKLSESQSIVTFAPPEVDNDIRTILPKQSQDAIDVADVIKWVIRKSCDALRAQETLNIVRQLEWLKRNSTFRDQVAVDGKVKNRRLYIENMLQGEVNKVEDLYGVGINSLLRLPNFSKQERGDKTVRKYLKKKEEIIDNRAHLEQSKDKEQEQEREQQHEREAEREVQRPKKMNSKDPEVNKFLEDAIRQDLDLFALPDGLASAFELMSRTSLYTSPLWQRFPKLLVATRDYLQTVKSSTGLDQDDFLRPVNWVLKFKSVRELILIGPYEAQRWMPHLRRSRNATLICYAARTTRDMVSFDKLDVYTVPERVSAVEVDADALTFLRLFAGQLYFNTFEEYERFCVLLSIRGAPEPRGQAREFGDRRGSMLKLVTKKRHEFVPIVKKFIDMRRKGVEWAFTDVGRVLNGEVLSVDHFKQREEM